ncbi:hypothetical protein GLOTRDRAFT_108906 [Gloeophyllum trabeum ATCC 11539]|uniref:Uncharacterized protein n=1 Tax=Gloeophyllum trabeum (strain ATCC 11539 / FP-39264 / Madison 617) TaxID=670483 RepID=S7RZB2_GLOTA|nr:uncharacterized protein GLOTRDRAFT_108906 [Gloeophyllum trabeum ATCC 11539]EPQ60335.1 hypothetical protein GLOTRDRAFT_108906 [Gloeophyllum trabeum ATCC 11539]
MGCIPSKQQVIETSTSTLPEMRPKSALSFGSFRNNKAKTRKPGPASPVISGDAPPWVRGHRVFILNEEEAGFRDEKIYS